MCPGVPWMCPSPPSPFSPLPLFPLSPRCNSQEPALLSPDTTVQEGALPLPPPPPPPPPEIHQCDRRRRSKQRSTLADTDPRTPGWGERYGGIHANTDCESFPAALKAGCKWRFDWFMGSDNPAVTFRAVTCPAEITAKSGCQRS